MASGIGRVETCLKAGRDAQLVVDCDLSEIKDGMVDVFNGEEDDRKQGISMPISGHSLN